MDRKIHAVEKIVDALEVQVDTINTKCIKSFGPDVTLIAYRMEESTNEEHAVEKLFEKMGIKDEVLIVNTKIMPKRGNTAPFLKRKLRVKLRKSNR